MKTNTRQRNIFYFGGPVVRLAQGVSVLVVASWLSLLGIEPIWAVKLLPVVILAGWVLLVLGSFWLELTPEQITRHLGPLTLALPWTDLQGAEIQPLPLLGPVRFVLAGSKKAWISFPLFLLAQESRGRLANLLAVYLPEQLRVGWVAEQFFEILRRKAKGS